MRLYYLTLAPFVLSNIALRRVKIARFAELNDPFELLAVNLRDEQYREPFRRFKSSLNESKGFLCFSKSWSNPVLWGHYAASHTGIALGFGVAEHLPVKAIYVGRLTKIEVDQATQRPVLDQPLMDKLLGTKFKDWRYENEWRVFVNLDHSTREAGLYFYDFSDELRLVEIILGPNCALPSERVSALVAGYSHPVKVSQSRVAFQNFRVIEQCASRSRGI